MYKNVYGNKQYGISETGVVINYKTRKVLKPYRTVSGYTCHVLYKNGIRKRYLTHRLVCMTYKPCVNMSTLTVDHINGIKNDNRVDNLEFVTIKENINRWYKNNIKTKDTAKVTIKYLKTNYIIEVENILVASRVLGVSKSEIARRLLDTSRIHKDYTLIKYSTSETPFRTIVNLDTEYTIDRRETPVDVLDLHLNTQSTFKTLTELCIYFNISLSYGHKLLTSSLLFSGRYVLKHKHDTFKYDNIHDGLLHGLNLGEFKRYIVYNNTLYSNSRELCRQLDIAPTLLNYRLYNR